MKTKTSTSYEEKSMSINKIRERKKQKKEKESRVKAARRREKVQAENRARKKDQQAAERARRKINPIRPYVKDPNKAKVRAEEVLAQLEKNLQILEALEEEYLREEEAKKKLNEELEAEGLTTLKEKLDALEKKAKGEIKTRGLEAHMGDEDEPKGFVVESSDERDT